MNTVERDVAVIRATCATKDDVQMLLERMNQQHLTLLNRMDTQHVALLERMDEQRVMLLDRMDQQRVMLLERMDQQHFSTQEKLAKLDSDMKDGRAEMYRVLGGWAWRLYGFVAVAMSGAFFIARYVH